MVAHINSVLLAGPFNGVKIRQTQYGPVANANLCGIKLDIQGKEDDKILPNLDKFQSAVVFDGTMESKQDTKDPQKIWHSVRTSSSHIIPVETQIPTLNTVTIVGRVVRADDTWVTVATSYMIKKTQEWRERYIYALCKTPMADAQGKTVLLVGAVRPKYNGNWLMYLEAETALILS